MVSLAVLRAIKVTPGLVARFALLPLRRVKNPCIYCPGICLASCPTFTSSGNLALSPLGYSRDRRLAAEKCAKCWRCVEDCPLGFPLPETYSEEAVKLELAVESKAKPILVAVEGLDVEESRRLSGKLGLGLAVVSGLLKRYTLGAPIDGKSLERVLRELEPLDPIAVSPEAAHALGIPFLLERPELLPRVSYTGKVHVPCLLRRRKRELLSSLEKLGVDVVGVDEESCAKVSASGDVLYLCPLAREKGARTIHDLL